MKNCKNIFMLVVSLFAFGALHAQSEAPAAPAAGESADETGSITLTTKNGTIKAAKKIQDGKVSVAIQVSGVPAGADLSGILGDIQRVSDFLMGNATVGATQGDDAKSSVQGAHASIIADKSESESGTSISAKANSVSEPTTVSNILKDFMDAIQKMLQDDNLELAGKVFTVNSSFDPGSAPSMDFKVGDAPDSEDPFGDDALLIEAAAKKLEEERKTEEADNKTDTVGPTSEEPDNTIITGPESDTQLK